MATAELSMRPIPMAHTVVATRTAARMRAIGR
jgi:hypothetical protein